MSLKRIPTSTGTKLKNTKTGKMAGAIGKGIEPPTAAQKIIVASSEHVETSGGRKRWKSGIDISHPELASEACDWDPSAVTAGSNKQLLWKCGVCSTTWTATPRGRVEGRGGKYCPTCPRNNMMANSIPLSIDYPEVAKEANGWDPSQYASKSGAKMLWKCSTCNHIWTVSISHRTFDSSGCPKCANMKTESLVISHPLLAREASGWDPSTIAEGSRLPRQWKCATCGNQWEASIHQRVLNPIRHGCERCNQYAGQYVKVFGRDIKVASPEESLQSRYPELVAEMVDPSPANILRASTHLEVEWKCSKCEHQWKASVKNRTAHDTGCPNCNEGGGFKNNESGYLYFIEGVRNGVPMIQYGITKDLGKRMQYHGRNNFQVKEHSKFLRFESGAEAARIEALIKTTLASKSVPSVKTDEDLEDKFDGYTESFRSDLLPVSSLETLLFTLGIEVNLGDAIAWVDAPTPIPKS